MKGFILETESYDPLLFVFKDENYPSVRGYGQTVTEAWEMYKEVRADYEAERGMHIPYAQPVIYMKAKEDVPEYVPMPGEHS